MKSLSVGCHTQVTLSLIKAASVTKTVQALTCPHKTIIDFSALDGRLCCKRRGQALIAALEALARDARVTITGLGRSLADTGVRIMHRVKRMDRLIGNRLLDVQRKAFHAPP